MNLMESVKILVEVLKNRDSSKEQINESISKYYGEVNKTLNDDEIEKSMQFLCKVFSLDNLKNGSIASLICSNLIKNGFSAKFIIDDFIDFFKEGIEESLPFIKLCEEVLQKENNHGEEEESEYDLIERKKKELKTKFSKSIHSLEGLDSYYQCGISIFSSGREAFEKGKHSLSAVSQYSIYNNAFYWFSKLFKVLYNEPIIVIDLITKKGFKGRISGIADNFQLQILLMGLPQLNEKMDVPKEYLDVVKGFHVQQLEESIVGKWNMYNWEYLLNDFKDSSSYSDSQHWIWGEGIPNDIATFNGFRVILLDNPSYSRGIPIQRTFKNLKAGIKVDKELNESQIEELILQMKNKN